MYGPQQTVEGGFEAMYAQTVDQALRGVGQETFEAIDQLKKINPDAYQPENGAQYPTSRFGKSLHGNRRAVQGRRRPRSGVPR